MRLEDYLIPAETRDAEAPDADADSKQAEQTEQTEPTQPTEPTGSA